MAGFTKEDAFRYLVSRGLSPVAAAGLVGNAMAESGLTPDIEERASVANKGFGLFQHTGPRRAQLVQYAADTGGSPADPYTQLDFVLKELRTTEQRAGEMLAGAQTAEDANAAALAFLRPAGWTPSGDVTKSSQYNTRLTNTRALMGDTPAAPAPFNGYTPAPPPVQEPAPAYVPPPPIMQQPQDPYGQALGGVTRSLTSLLPVSEPMARPQPMAPVPMQPMAPLPMAQQPMSPAPTRRAALQTTQPAAIQPALGDDIFRRLGGLWGNWS